MAIEAGIPNYPSAGLEYTTGCLCLRSQRIQTRPVTHWQNGKMVIRWLASAFFRTEKRFNKIMGDRDLWTMEATLNNTQPATGQVAA
jgi:hypothetical protein